MDLDNFITLVEIPPGSRRFVLGPFERGITLLKQQTRAINLIYALHEKRILKSGGTLAVIGGGIAGTTAAAAGAILGYKVYLLELGQSLVHLQNGCDTRWLHPHIYEWPDAGADRLYAELPVLNWRASSASNVAKQILQQFNELKRSTKRISVFLGATVGAIDGMRMEWSSTLPLENYEQEFNALIFAVGFGIERRVNSQRQSYWRNDSYHQSAPGAPADLVTNYLVSGTGDGGLIDLMRIKIANYDHSRILNELFDDCSNRVIQNLRSIKNEWKNEKGPLKHTWLFDCYQDLWDKRRLKGVVQRLQSRLRTDTKAVLNGRLRFGQALRLDTASMFNTLVTYQLFKLRAFEYVAGEISIDTSPPRVGSKTFKDHQLIIRHGADVDKTYTDVGFPDVPALRQSPDKIRQYFDTAIRLWPAGWWSRTPTKGPSNSIEYVSPATVTLATTFVSTLRDMVKLVYLHDNPRSHEPDPLEFRITLHRLLEIQKQSYFQQIARYAGTENRLKGVVGRVFSVDSGIGGFCCRLGKPVKVVKGVGFDELRNDLKLDLLHARPIDENVESFLAVPFFATASSKSSEGRNPIVLVLYVDSNRAKFFSNDVLTTIYVACRGFVRNVAAMQRHRELSFSSSDYPGFISPESDADKRLLTKHKAHLGVDEAIFKNFKDYLTFDTFGAFDVALLS